MQKGRRQSQQTTAKHQRRLAKLPDELTKANCNDASRGKVRAAPTGPKLPQPVDVYVGSRVRHFRQRTGWNQEQLAQALGLTFQQVQKYEKGTNRISAGRLQEISAALKVPLSVFFEGGPSASPPPNRAATLELAELAEALNTADGKRLCETFLLLGPQQRRKAVLIVKLLAAPKI
jgi:transcriptional regulator with XRE-family HTH domain